MTTLTAPRAALLPSDPTTWTDADKATYLADDIEMNGFASATCAFDPWEPAVYVKALRFFAASERARSAPGLTGEKG